MNNEAIAGQINSSFYLSRMVDNIHSLVRLQIQLQSRLRLNNQPL